MRRNSPTVKGLAVKDERDLGTERRRLCGCDRPVCRGRFCGLHHASAQLLRAATPEEWYPLCTSISIITCGSLGSERQSVATPRQASSEPVPMTSRQALAFIRQHGVVLESANGPVPRLPKPSRESRFAAIGGLIRMAVRSSRSRERSATATTSSSADLIKGKVTFVHRRNWPALVRLAGRLPSADLSRVSEVHTSSGRHVVKQVPFPDWVPLSVRAAARRLSEEAALAEFGAWLESKRAAANRRPRPTAAPLGR